MAKVTQPKDLADIVNLAEISQPIYKPQDYFEVPLLLESFEAMKGDKGDFFVLTCKVIETDETLLFSTGAWQPKKVIAELSPRNLPIMFKFVDAGKSYFMASCKPTE